MLPGPSLRLVGLAQPGPEGGFLRIPSLSNEKRAPGCLIGELYYPVMWGL